MTVPVLFRLRGVRFSYDGRTEALAGVDLDLPAGGVIALVGGNGAGKTTLMGLLGLLWEGSPPSGTITYRPGQEGELVYGQGDAAAFRRSTFGFIPQKRELLPFLTLGENIGLPLRLSGVPPAEVDRRVRERWKELGHPESDLNKYQGSGGQDQIAWVLRGLAHAPDVLFTDEPFLEVDAATTPHFLDLLWQWLHDPAAERSRTLILASHYLEDLMKAEVGGQPFVQYFVPFGQGLPLTGPNDALPPFTYDQVQKGGGVELLKKWIARQHDAVS